MIRAAGPRVLVLSLVLAVGQGAVGAARVGPAGPLDEVVVRVERSRAAGERPVVVFDLDDTIFRVSYRTKKILRDWAATLSVATGELVHRIDALDPERMPYYLKGSLDRLGVSDPELRRQAEAAWGRGFFASGYLVHDGVMPGAVEYVGTLRRHGATIVYLTGRDGPRMRAGTVAALRRAGFPVPGHRVHLLMKPAFRIKDVVYKQSAVARVRRMGRVVASFDNEPRNLNMFWRSFPGALIVKLDTPHSDDPTPLTAGIPTVKHFIRTDR